MNDSFPNKEIPSDKLPRIESSFENPIPFHPAILSLNRLILAFYNRASYRFPIYTTGRIVDVKEGNGSLYHYFGLAQSGDYLPAKIKNENDNYQRLQVGFQAVVKGYFNLESSLKKPFLFEIKLNVMEIHLDLTDSSEVKMTSTKPIPESIKRIGLITSPNSEAIPDFYKGLKAARNWLKIQIHEVNLLSPESISEGIKTADAVGYDVLILTRGGEQDLYLFSDHRIVLALQECKTYTITGLGHADNNSDSDKVADMSVETPTSAGVYIKNLIGQKYFANKKLMESPSHQSQNQISSHLIHTGAKPGKIFSASKFIKKYLILFLLGLVRICRKLMLSALNKLFSWTKNLIAFVLMLVVFVLGIFILSLLLRGCVA